uniref:Saposin B-type domain-containing protein n=1 Tax=Steinernema glaseri TaxID=37863 RepID=A0A1I7ZN41_9BILA
MARGVLWCVLIVFGISVQSCDAIWELKRLHQYPLIHPTNLDHRLTCVECLQHVKYIKEHIDSWWMEYLFPSLLELWCGLETGFDADICFPALDCILMQLNVTVHQHSPNEICSIYKYCPGPTGFDLTYSADCKDFYASIRNHGDEDVFKEDMKSRIFNTCVSATKDSKLCERCRQDLWTLFYRQAHLPTTDEACFLQCDKGRKRRSKKMNEL